MIILDTCVIRSMKLDGSEAHLLRAIRDAKAERVGVPWMVMEERAAQLAIKYREAYDKAALALNQLRKEAPGPVPELQTSDEEAVRERYREQLRELADVLPTSEAALREGVVREANALPPAGVKKDMKVGARDVSIWLSAVEYARDHPDETIYFVSSNTKDFTAGGGSYPSPMDKDIEGLGDHFVHLPQLANLLELVAPSVAVTPEQVEELLPSCIHHFQDVAVVTWGSPISAMTAPYPALSQSTGSVENAYGWLGPQGAMHFKVLQVDDVQGYKLGAEEWFTASVQWQVVGLMRFASGLGIGCCTWETRIMMPLVEGGPTPRILRSERPKAPEPREHVDWPTVPLSSLSHLPEAKNLLTSLQSESKLVRTLAMINYALSALRVQGTEVRPLMETDVLTAMAIAEEQDPPDDDDIFGRLALD
ncbi:PIN domain-containing protein [Streptomyces brevispora]|uniref:PIN domain-containing protein n=1 Tax=Streptomyces brevispora TaxID=887462 RepID=UPI0037FEEDD0